MGSSMILALTPEALIQGRVAAVTRHDFRAIYFSYHPDAPFLNFFPDCDVYLAYAEAELAHNFQIRACRILRTSQQGETADVLFSLQLNHEGQVSDTLEIARCRCDDLGNWSFEAGLRLDALKLPAEFLHCSWAVLIAAGNDLWI